MTVTNYFQDVEYEMARKSEAIRRAFKRHHPSAGQNLEDIVGKFLQDHLPRRFGVSTGFVISHNEQFSQQADLLVVDNQNNVPLYLDVSNKLWPVEAVYALIEVKAELNKRSLQDSLKKGRAFKSLERRYHETGRKKQHTGSSLFVIWAFESIKPVTLKAHLMEELSEVPPKEQPDLIVVPECLVAISGYYLETVRIGEPGSHFRRERETRSIGDISLPEPAELYDLGKRSLHVWYVWFDSWIRRAGVRFPDPMLYLQQDQLFGTRI